MKSKIKNPIFASLFGFACFTGCNSISQNYDQLSKNESFSNELPMPSLPSFDFNDDFFKLYISMMEKSKISSGEQKYSFASISSSNVCYIVESKLSLDNEPSLRVCSFFNNDRKNALLYVDGINGKLDGIVDQAFECSVSLLSASPIRFEIDPIKTIENPEKISLAYRFIASKAFKEFKNAFPENKIEEKPVHSGTRVKEVSCLF